VVYEVERVTDGQRLALKLVTGEVSGAQAARFAREAEIGARVRHRNLVSIVDVGIASGAPFLVMEMAARGSLEEMRDRFGDPAWARPILTEIAEGLAALHDAGVVHRDLKPANVLFTAEGDEGLVAKISDFGISGFGALDTTIDVDPTANTINVNAPAVRPSALTATGALLGTPYYMAPEAARGASMVGSAADVFAFGILACEMMTGRAPFAMPPVFTAMAGDRLPSPTLDENVAGAIRAAIVACLAEDPSVRPSMKRVRHALDSTTETRTTHETASSSVS
jgi:serine/threonine-protein kinase